jgi:hypothetical protein
VPLHIDANGHVHGAIFYLSLLAHLDHHRQYSKREPLSSWKTLRSGTSSAFCIVL